jgi:type IX secretion system protein PorV
MKIFKNSIIQFVLIIFLVSTMGLSQNPVGTSAASFLGIPIGPRAQALGGAYLAMSKDVTSAYWNPGALSRIGHTQVLISHTDWFLGTSLNWVGVNIQIDEANAIAISLTQMDYGSEEITTIFEQEGTGRYWDAVDLAAAVTYSRKLTSRFSMGGSLKLIHSQIFNESASAFAVDLGVLYNTELEGLSLGMSIANYGSKMRMDGKDLFEQIDIDPENSGHNERLVSTLKTDEWALPIFFRIGVAMDVLKVEENRLTLAADALHPTDNVESMNLGIEYCYNDLISLRGGYRSLFQEDSEGGLSLGGGIKYDVPNFANINIEYAWSDYGVIDPDGIQTFALTISF